MNTPDSSTAVVVETPAPAPEAPAQEATPTAPPPAADTATTTGTADAPNASTEKCACGNLISKDQVEAWLTSTPGTPLVCGDCLGKAASATSVAAPTDPTPAPAAPAEQPAVEVESPKDETKTEEPPAPPAPEAEITIEQLEGKIEALGALIKRAEKTGAKTTPTQMLQKVWDEVYAELNNPETADQDPAILFKKIQKSMDGWTPAIEKAEQRARENAERKEREAEKNRKFQPRKGLAAKMLLTRTPKGGVDLADLKAAVIASGNGNGNGNGTGHKPATETAAPVVNRITPTTQEAPKPATSGGNGNGTDHTPKPSQATTTPKDVPCNHPGCKETIPGWVVARWNGPYAGPKGGWKCRQHLPDGHKAKTNDSGSTAPKAAK